MRPRRIVDPRVRDAALRRLHRLTALAVVAATALTGVFAGLAAGSVPGRKVVPAAATPAGGSLRLTPARRRVREHATPAAAAAVTPAPPLAPPAPTPAPPVVVSGGS